MPSKGTRVLVTGGAGFIGSHVVDRLVQRGCQVRVLDLLQPRVHPKGKPAYLPKEAEFLQGDVRKREDLIRGLDGVEEVFHLAAYQDYMPDFSTFIHTNTVSLALLLELIVEKSMKVRKIVYASSQAAYGEGMFACATHGKMIPGGRPLEQLQRADWEIHCPQCGAVLQWQYTDETAFNPYSAYAISKYAKEVVGMNLGKRYGIPTVGLRYSITHGPRNSYFNAYSGICRIFTSRMLKGQPPIIFEDGLQLRDYGSVYDVADGNILAMEKDEANHQVINLGAGKPISVIEFYETLASVMGFTQKPILSGEFRVGDTRHTISDIGKAKRLLGWEPRVPLRKTLTDYVEWLKAQGPLEDYVTTADKEMRDKQVIRPTHARPL